MRRCILAVAAALVTAFIAIARAQTPSMAQIAQEYVRLVLAMGHHDPDYVDAYYGPADIKAEADAAKLSLHDIGNTVNTLIESVKGVRADGNDELARLRHQYLEKQLSAMSARVR